MEEDKSIQITTSESEQEGARRVTVSYNLGGDLAGAAELFTAEVVYSKFVQQCRVDIQGLVRRLLKAGKPDEEIYAAVASYTPTIAAKRGRTDIEKAQALLGKLTPEQKAALLAELEMED